MRLTVDKVSEKYKKFVNPSIARAFNLIGCGIEARASGAVVIDASDKEYIDIENPFLHTSTFGGNQLACTAASAIIEVLLNERIIHRVEIKGTLLHSRLRALQKNGLL